MPKKGFDHDHIVLLDYRQNLTYDDMKNFKMGPEERVNKFKDRKVDFISLTDAVLLENNNLNHLTAFSKIIIRGHCDSGSDFISSDLHGRLVNLHNQLSKKASDKIESNNQEGMKVLDEIKYINGRKSILLSNAKMMAMQNKSFASSQAYAEILKQLEGLDSALLRLNAIMHDLALKDRELTEEANRDIVPKLNAIEKRINTQFLTVDKLSDFLKRNVTGNIIPVEIKIPGANNKNTTTRRLTIQNAMCHGAMDSVNGDGTVSASFLKKLYKTLAQAGLETNVVGYKTSTAFLHAAVKFNSELGFMWAQSTGMHHDRNGAEPDSKTLFNKEHPEGTPYLNWKNSNYSATDGPIGDLLTEIHRDIWDKSKWDNKGRSWYGSHNKVPDGINKIRGQLPEGWIVNNETDASIKLKWKSIKLIIENKATNDVRSRDAETRRFYADYMQIMRLY